MEISYFHSVRAMSEYCIRLYYLITTSEPVSLSETLRSEEADTWSFRKTH